MGDNLSISSLPTRGWKASPPPLELLHSPPGTSNEIESILEASIQQLQSCFAEDERLEQLAAERDRLEREQLTVIDNNLQQRQEHQRLAVESDRLEQQQFRATRNSLLRRQLTTKEYHLEQQKLVADISGIPVDDTPRSTSVPSNSSKGKEKSIQESQEKLPNMDFQGTVSRNRVQPPQTQGDTSSAATSKNSAVTLESRSLSPEIPPAYAKTSSAAAVSPPADVKGSSTAAVSPSVDIQRASARKWGLRLIRPYVTTVFKPRSRSGRGILSKRTSESTSKKVECVSCMEEFCVKEMVHLTCHDYCSPCFTLLIETSISSESSWPPKCCLNEVPKPIIMSNVRGKLKSRYEAMIEERSIAIEDRVYCSKASCGSWIPLHKIDKPLVLARCSRCRHKTCMICRGSYHYNGECPEDSNLRETLRCAIDAGWRRCFKCNALVEHDQGCSHMTCRCRAQFCYTCGLKWKTCGCKETELEAHLTAAQWRTENGMSQTQVRQAAYAALGREADADQTEFSNELREILDLLENSENISPAERDAGEIALALTAQREAEENRARDFEDKLQRLREELDFVHSIQQITNFDRFEAENKALLDAAKAELAHIDEAFHVLTREEKDRVAADYVALFKGCHTKPPKEMIDAAVKRAAMTKAIDRQLARELKPNPLNGPEELEIEGEEMTEYNGPEELEIEGEEMTEYVEFFKRYGYDPIDHCANIARREAAMSAAREEIFAQEKKHGQQKAIINARLEAKQERLRAGHQSDKKWFEEVAMVRDAMVMQMAIDEYSL